MTGLPMMSLKKLEGSLPSPAPPFSIVIFNVFGAVVNECECVGGVAVNGSSTVVDMRWC